MCRRATSLAAAGLLLCLGAPAAAQEAAAPPPAPSEEDTRGQYPAFLSNAYVSLNLGYMNYAFSDVQLEPGHQVESVHVPHVAVRAILFGRHFGKYVSAQASYLRPVKYVQYRNVDGGDTTRFVWMHFGTVTLQSRVPVSSRVSVYGEGGFAITNRSGFDVDDAPVVRDAHFMSPLAGLGLDYRVSDTWDVVAGGTYIFPRDEERQPHTLLVSTGFRYNLRPLPPARVEETRNAGFIFREHLVQVEYATNAFGYGVNNFVSRTVPIFWGGKVEVKRSVFSMRYQRNVFHTKKVFALDIGAGVAQWRSNQHEDGFRTVSVYPLMRFTVLRSRAADLYVSYSVAGPSYISTDVIDGRDTGSHFTFQDFMGVGLFIGARKHLNAEVGLNHYSNGNILTENAGVKVPLTFRVGYAF